MAEANFLRYLQTNTSEFMVSIWTLFDDDLVVSVTYYLYSSQKGVLHPASDFARLYF